MVSSLQALAKSLTAMEKKKRHEKDEEVDKDSWMSSWSLSSDKSAEALTAGGSPGPVTAGGAAFSSPVQAPDMAKTDRGPTSLRSIIFIMVP